MALPEVQIVTAAEMVDSTGAPLSGAQITYQLDRNDLDVATNTLIFAVPEAFVTLDAAGLLPAATLQLWANTRGRYGSRWKIGVRLAGKWLIEPVPTQVPEPTLPATSIDLMALLTTFATPAMFLPSCQR